MRIAIADCPGHRDSFFSPINRMTVGHCERDRSRVWERWWPLEIHMTLARRDIGVLPTLAFENWQPELGF